MNSNIDMNKLKNIAFTACCLLAGLTAVKAQNKNVFDKNYRFVHSENLVADKDFYLLTVIEHTPAVKTLIANDADLKQVLTERLEMIKSRVADTSKHPQSLVGGFRYTADDSTKLTGALHALYKKNQPSFDQMINAHLRASGYYQRFAGLSNAELYLKAWGQYFYGINYIIDQFGLGKKMRYPRIDSASYVVQSRYYCMVMKDMFALLDEQTGGMKLFYQPSLQVALHLMDANDRDEPARFEPMETTVNTGAVARIKTTD